MTTIPRLPGDPRRTTLPALLLRNADEHGDLPALSWRTGGPVVDADLARGAARGRRPRRRLRRARGAARRARPDDDGQPPGALAERPGPRPPRRRARHRVRDRRARTDRAHRAAQPRPVRDRRGRAVNCRAGSPCWPTPRRRWSASWSWSRRRGGRPPHVRLRCTPRARGSLEPTEAFEKSWREIRARRPAHRRLHLGHHRRPQGRPPQPPQRTSSTRPPWTRRRTPRRRRAHLLPALRPHRGAHARHLPAGASRRPRPPVRGPGRGRRHRARTAPRPVLRRPAGVGEAGRRPCRPRSPGCPQERRAAVEAANDDGARATSPAASGARNPPPSWRAAYDEAKREVLDPLLALAGFDRLVWTASASAPMPLDVSRFWAGFGHRDHGRVGAHRDLRGGHDQQPRPASGSARSGGPSTDWSTHRRRRRDPGARRDGLRRLPAARRRRRQRLRRGRLVRHRRHRTARRGRLPLAHRPQEGNDRHLDGQERLARPRRERAQGTPADRPGPRPRRRPLLSGGAARPRSGAGARLGGGRAGHRGRTWSPPRPCRRRWRAPWRPPTRA